jgi:hypothetical protein
MEVKFYQSFQQWAVMDGEAIIAFVSKRDDAEQLASLMAAAPDLLEACQDMMHHLFEYETELGEALDSPRKAMAAIAKAEGK